MMSTTVSQKSSPQATVFREAQGHFEIQTANPRFEARDVGVAAATADAYAIKVFRAREGGDVRPALHRHDADFQYVHIIRGEIDFLLEGGRRERLAAGDSVLQPKGCVHCVVWMSDDLELLEIFSPASIQTTAVEH
jgi:quercetin dioxygenase-like cupin family protein